MCVFFKLLIIIFYRIDDIVIVESQYDHWKEEHFYGENKQNGFS